MSAYSSRFYKLSKYDMTPVTSRDYDVMLTAAIINPAPPPIQQRDFVREADFLLINKGPCARRVTLHVKKGPRVWWGNIAKNVARAGASGYGGRVTHQMAQGSQPIRIQHTYLRCNITRYMIVYHISVIYLKLIML